MLRKTLFLHSNPGGGAPAPSPSPAPTTPAPAPAPTTTPPQPAGPNPGSTRHVGSDYIGQQLLRYGTLEAALIAVGTQLLGFLDREPGLQQTMTTMRQQIEAGVVLTAEQKQLWDALVAAKITDPKKLEKITTRLAELETETAEGRRQRLGAEAARAGGYNELVFNDLTRDRVVEMRDTTVKENGKDLVKKLPWVRVAADDKAAFEPFDAFVTREKAAYIPALKAGAAAPTGAPPATGTGTVTWPNQPPAGPQPTGDPVQAFADRIQKERDSRPNPAAGNRAPVAPVSPAQAPAT